MLAARRFHVSHRSSVSSITERGGAWGRRRSAGKDSTEPHLFRDVGFAKVAWETYTKETYLPQAEISAPWEGVPA